MTAENPPQIQNNEAIGPRDLLGIRNFRFLWLGQIVSNFGDSLTGLALMLLVNHLTGSIAALATMMIVLAIPQITVGLVAGVYVDRLDRKRIMIVSDILRGLLVIGFVFVDTPEKIWLLYVIGFLQAAVGTFFMPARTALIPNLVPEKGLLGANSISETSRIIFGLLGTGAAGAIIGALDVFWPAFAIDALTFFGSFLLLSQIRGYTRRPETDSPVNVRVVTDQLREGLQITIRTPVMLGTLVGMGVTMLGLGAVNILLVPLLINDLNVSATWFAGLEFAQTSAMILSGSLIAVLASRFKATRIASGALIGLGVVIALMSQINSVWHIVILLFAAGWVITPIQASLTTLVQTAVSDEVRGRTGAARGAIVSTASLISMGLAGALGELVGVRNVFIISGGIVVLAGLGAGWVFRNYTGVKDKKRVSSQLEAAD